MMNKTGEDPGRREPDNIRDALDRPLLPALINKKDGREYLAIYLAVTQANRIFGHGGWFPEIRQHAAVTDRQGYVIGYKCVARVTIPALGIHVEGIGFEQMTRRRGQDHPNQDAQAHDTAMKGAESDAVKRALRYLGDQFGNSLYEKTDDRRKVYRFAERAVRTVEGSLDKAKRKLLGPFRSEDEVPVSAMLKQYFGATETIRSRRNEEDTTEVPDEDPEEFPEIEDNDRDESEDNEDHDDLTPRRRRRDPFRGRDNGSERDGDGDDNSSRRRGDDPEDRDEDDPHDRDGAGRTRDGERNGRGGQDRDDEESWNDRGQERDREYSRD